MKKIVALAALIFMVTGCSQVKEEFEKAEGACQWFGGNSKPAQTCFISTITTCSAKFNSSQENWQWQGSKSTCD